MHLLSFNFLTVLQSGLAHSLKLWQFHLLYTFMFRCLNISCEPHLTQNLVCVVLRCGHLSTEFFLKVFKVKRCLGTSLASAAKKGLAESQLSPAISGALRLPQHLLGRMQLQPRPSRQRRSCSDAPDLPPG